MPPLLDTPPEPLPLQAPFVITFPNHIAASPLGARCANTAIRTSYRGNPSTGLDYLRVANLVFAGGSLFWVGLPQGLRGEL